VRYVLSNGGHVAGIVNPPGPEGPARGGRQEPAHRRRVARVSGEPQWFLVGGDWTRWAGKRAGALTAPPPWGSRRQVLGEQPVLDKSTRVR